MARYVISAPAQEDLRKILSISAEHWGREGRRRYARTLAAAMRRVAAEPNGRNTFSRDELLSGLRSFHIRHVRDQDPSAKVMNAVHVLYYRTVEGDLVEIIRVLHERMEPSRQFRSSEGQV
jgi:toxin ParE1/3/4